MSLKDYIIRDIQEKFKYLPSAVYLALICIAMYIFVCLLRYLFTMREVSQADERRKNIVGKIWHMLFCGTAAIEYTQLVTGRGYCQLDDFVTNTAGSAIGFFIYLILYAGWLIWKKIR